MIGARVVAASTAFVLLCVAGCGGDPPAEFGASGAWSRPTPAEAGNGVVYLTVTTDTADALVARLAPRVAALKVGPASDPASEMGPLVTQAHFDRVKGYVDLGIEEGAQLVVDGRGIQVAGHPNGFYLGGCLFDHVTEDMRIYR